jgi:hypothetical protein
MHGRRLVLGGRRQVGPEGLVCLPPVRGIFLARDFGKRCRQFAIILADNYNQTTNGPTTEAHSAQRTHRDIFGKEIRCSLHLCDHCATGSSAGQPQGRALHHSGPGCCSWPLPVDLAVWSCLLMPEGLTYIHALGAGVWLSLAKDTDLQTSRTQEFFNLTKA